MWHGSPASAAEVMDGNLSPVGKILLKEQSAEALNSSRD